jgi:hypothetical protein
MNIAIVSLAIFLIVSPAIITRRTYFTKELSKSFTNKNTLQEIFSAIFLTGLLHSIWIIFVEYIGYKIDFDILFKLLFDPRSITDYSNITNNIYKIITYFISLTSISAILSYLFRNLVRVKKWDRKTNFLRYDNNWYYLFSGEVLDIKQYSDDNEISSDDINQRLVDVLAKSNDKEVIYRGNLIDYQLDKNNSVEYIVLSYPTKRQNGISKTITSNYFIIPYSEILNINLKYLSTMQTDGDSETVTD